MNSFKKSIQIWYPACFRIILLFSVLSGCDNPDDALSGGAEPYFDHAGLPVNKLTGSKLSVAPAIGQPSLVQINAGMLWVSDMASDPGLHAVDATNGDLIRSLGTRGEGPGEFSTSPFSLEVVEGDSGIWAFDLGLQRISRFESRSATAYEVSIIQLQGKPKILRVAWLTPEIFVGQSNSRDRFSIFSSAGERLEVVEGPLLGPDDAPESERLKATNAAVQICPWPGRGFAVVNFKVGRVELYDQSARLVRLADVPFPDEARFVTGDDGRVKFESVREWYMDCAVSGDRLFALFSGRLGAAYENFDKFASEFIHVFDWEGQLKTVYALDRPVNAISVDTQGSIVYASSLSDATLYRFALPRNPARVAEGGEDS